MWKIILNVSGTKIRKSLYTAGLVTGADKLKLFLKNMDIKKS